MNSLKSNCVVPRGIKTVRLFEVNEQGEPLQERSLRGEVPDTKDLLLPCQTAIAGMVTWVGYTSLANSPTKIL